MSANVLQFSLGLATGQFTKALDTSAGKLMGFAATATKLTGVGAAIGAGFAGIKGMFNVVEGVMDVFERSEGLVHLSKTSGESVRNLVLLQKGLRAVGLDAGGAGQMLFMLQRSLGGVNEEGLPTSHVFTQLGLSIADIKKMDAPNQLLAIAKSIDKLDNSAAAAASAKIFGRSSAKDFLQLARSTDEFKEALKKAAVEAGLLQRNAAMLGQIHHTIEMIKSRFKGLYLGIAIGMAPAIKTVLALFDKIDWVGIGKKIGSVFTVLTEAFKQGKLGQLVGLGIQAGFAMAVNFFWRVMNGVWAGLKARFSTMFDGVGSILENVAKAFGNNMTGQIKFVFSIPFTVIARLPEVFTKLANLFGDVFGAALQKVLGKAIALLGNTLQTMGLGLGGKGMELVALAGKIGNDFDSTKAEKGTAAAIGSIGQNLRASAFDDFGKAGEQIKAAFFGIINNVTNSGMATADAFLKAFKETPDLMKGEARKQFADLYKSLLSGAPLPKELQIKKSGEGALEANYKTERTSIEKMGFVFGSGSVTDYNATTARNTTAIAAIARETLAVIKGKSGGVGDLLVNAHA